ncbi:uncharacterized protein EDB93DRAFT_1253482 [Suillus bovinus]|uniref:uncharacterized protein n=1 Tax=Suillus bovinus TaxID=48563 RepID=UPI001B869261|nr:uncharacterized protein EDB93DRAFT_1253482 [Suillus bovinus]KAG2138101.1 hypothetical protein EDB93DRAFT_1253482 [Suillus bovinus]
MPGRRRRANKAQAAAVATSTAAPIPVATSTAAPIPAAAAANTTTLLDPHEGESFDLENISADEEELGNPPVLTVIAPVGNPPVPTAIAQAGSNPSPLQTIMSTTRTNPLATGNLKQTKGPTDIAQFYRIDSNTKVKTCTPCVALHEIDGTHKVQVYTGSTASSAPHNHAFIHHTELYLEAAEHFGWHITIKDLSEWLAEGWTLTMICEQLKKSPCTMQTLGPPPNQGSDVLWLVGTSSQEDVIPDFTLDEMHCQIVKFIVADDQAREMIIEQWQEYFVALKKDLSNAQGKICFTSDLWLDFKLQPFMAIMAHCISKANADSALVLKAALIVFHHIPGSHNGGSLGSMILYLLAHITVTYFHIIWVTRPT